MGHKLFHTLTPVGSLMLPAGPAEFPPGSLEQYASPRAVSLPAFMVMAMERRDTSSLFNQSLLSGAHGHLWTKWAC